jgi:hypothetical protein
MHITNITKAKEEYKKQKDLIFGEIKRPNCMQLVKFFDKCCCESTKNPCRGRKYSQFETQVKHSWPEIRSTMDVVRQI